MGDGELLFNRCRILIGEDEKVMEMDGGGVAENVFNATQLYT